MMPPSFHHHRRWVSKRRCPKLLLVAVVVVAALVHSRQTVLPYTIDTTNRNSNGSHLPSVARGGGDEHDSNNSTSSSSTSLLQRRQLLHPQDQDKNQSSSAAVSLLQTLTSYTTQLITGRQEVAPALTEPDTDTDHDNNDDKELGTIVILAPRRNSPTNYNAERFCLLLIAVRSIDVHLNRFYGPYPIHLVVAKDYELDPDGKDGLYTEADRALIRSWAPNSTIHFVEVNMYSHDAFEPNMTMSDAVQWLAEMPSDFPHKVGYASMCRLWSGRLQQMEFLQQYQYYMRMDDDSLFVEDVRFDPFQRMKELDLLYAYHREVGDYWSIQELWETVRPYITVTNRTPFVTLHGEEDERGDYPHATYHGRQPYNNFHVTAVSFWNTPPWTNVWETMNRNHTFFKHRVGDANVHAMACMMMPPERLQHWQNYSYRHNSNEMEGFGFQAWQDECNVAYEPYGIKAQS